MLKKGIVKMLLCIKTVIQHLDNVLCVVYMPQYPNLYQGKYDVELMTKSALECIL